MTDRNYPPHSDWGQDPSGYCGCKGCSSSEEENEPKHKAEPTITVSGNHITFTRLDPEGNPIGEPIEMGDAINGVSFDLPIGDAEVIDWDMTTDHTLTVELRACEVDQDLLALLTGWGPVVPSRGTRLIRFIKRWKWTITGAVLGLALTVGSVWWIRFLYRAVTQ